MRAISGWGRYPVVLADERVDEDLARITLGASLTRGLGRSYGDASLPAVAGAVVAGSRLADRIIEFDRRRGLLRAEAGLSLSRLHRVAWPVGWSSPVIPGTQFVSLGGMVAADVHGKNHHVRGSFGNHVRALRMRLADGRIVEIDEGSEPELFRATLGGMGLTGHLLEVELALEPIPSPWIHQQKERFADLDSLLVGLGRAGDAWPFTVAWADCLARGSSMGGGILIKGRWARKDEAPRAIPGAGPRVELPFDLPSWVLAEPAVRLFNTAYLHWLGMRHAGDVVDPVGFFHPLDAVTGWNRLYGRHGFIQYQCVVADRAAVHRLFDVLARRAAPVFLAVIKDFGPTSRGMISFPMPGLTVSLDLPFRGDATQKLVDELNEVVVDGEGRVYLAKDALTRDEHFRAMEPRLARWTAVRRAWDPARRIKTALSARLLGDAC
ncbi:MAG TPA: FAD-binding oxidoreductase [Candidatus Polarisedimenticolaceae bacterium]|nr:FAD-binding oxidoreductase [Candidatus Polarisedimenticolaceae bacterium]